MSARLSSAYTQWLLDRGLPAFAQHRPRLSELCARVAPMAVFVLVGQIFALVVGAIVAFVLRSPIFASLESDGATVRAVSTLGEQENALAQMVALATLLIPIFGIIAAILLAWLVSRQNAHVRQRIGWIAMVGCVFAPLIARIFMDFTGLFSSSPVRIIGWLMIRVCAVLVVLWTIRIGFGSIVSYAWRQARRQVGAMGPVIAKALPLTVLAFLFAFFAAETWQVAAGLSTGRLICVLVILFGLAFALVAMTISERIDDVVTDGLSAQRASDLMQATQLLSESPNGSGLAPTVDGQALEDDPPVVELLRAEECPSRLYVPLTRWERRNLVVVHVLVHMWQAIVFAAFIFIFLVGFSLVAIPSGIETKWTELPVKHLVVNGVTLPVTWAYVKVCSLLAAVSALSYAGAAASDDFYTRTFMRDLSDDVEQVLAVKHSGQCLAQVVGAGENA
ncbi:hypothetical protein [Trueperella sp. LYQ143]|uniref:hypothetical protein n=1 Tax=unclassified Trueperella TaxID=2630174 RepID=UPI003983604A